MKTVCSYCGAVLESSATESESDLVSHGICRPCYDHFSRQWSGLSLGEYLDSFECPVLVVESSGRAVAANAKMAAMLGKPERDIFGLLGGDAMECVYARLPQGCGKTVHCATCAILLTATQAFETGVAQREVAASLTQEGGTIALIISAIPENDFVRVEILRVAEKSANEGDDHSV